MLCAFPCEQVLGGVSATGNRASVNFGADLTVNFFGNNINAANFAAAASIGMNCGGIEEHPAFNNYPNNLLFGGGCGCECLQVAEHVRAQHKVHCV